MFSWISIPSTTDIVANIKGDETSIFSNLSIFLYFLLALVLGGAAVGFVYRAVLAGVGKFVKTGGKRRGRGRRR